MANKVWQMTSYFHFNKKYIAVFAFLTYCIYNFIYLAPHPLFPDESRFIGEAIDFVKYGEFRIGSDRAWEMPLTGSFYGLIYFVTGSEIFLIYVVRFLQALMLILQAFMMAKISFILFKNSKASNWTFFIILFYPFFVYYQALLLSETIFMTFLIGAFLAFYKWYENDSFAISKNFYLYIILITLSVYTKATLSFLIPILAPLSVLVISKDILKSIKILLMSILIYALLLSPWWIRNYVIFDSFIPFTTSSGMNFYLGNNEYNLQGGCDWSKDVDGKKVEYINSVESEIEKNKAYTSEAKQYIAKNPERFLELAWLKFKRFYNVVPNADGFNSGFYKWISILSYGIILPFGLYGAFITRREYKKLFPIYLLFVYFTLIHVVIIASLRYRLPLEPFMIFFASIAVSHFYTKLAYYCEHLKTIFLLRK